MRTILLTLASAALLAGASACGAGDDAAEPAGGGGGGGGGERVEVVLSDFALEPSTVTLSEAGTYTFVARNEGAVDHALKIDGEGFEAETPVLAPGEEAEVSVQIAEGEHEMYCPVGNHREMGMEGAVVVGTAGGGGETTTGDETTTDDDGGEDEDDDYRY